jgi:hypothetical protein
MPEQEKVEYLEDGLYAVIDGKQIEPRAYDHRR